MFCALIRIARKVNRWVVCTAKVIARRVADAWRHHLDRVADIPDTPLPPRRSWPARSA